ncbi:MAG: hypothetical protein HYX95_03460, partial [Chloroflexi bacterium]|nr:hypothetical protein [Chloroflexota bacterium]
MAIDSFGMAEIFDPIKSVGTAATDMFMAQIFDFMFNTEKGKLLPGIIERWEMAPDGLSWTYHVRKGIKFHNGDNLTARDVKFSLDRFASKDTTQSNLRVILDRVEQVDDYTVRVFTKTPQPYLPTFSSVNSPAQGQVMPKDYIEKNGPEYFSRNPVGAGPWRLTRVVSGDLIEYEAVTNHWRKTPAFKKLTLFQVPE